jgi:hypothetical protein
MELVSVKLMVILTEGKNRAFMTTTNVPDGDSSLLLYASFRHGEAQVQLTHFSVWRRPGRH